MAKAKKNMFDMAPVVEVKAPESKDKKSREVNLGTSLDYLAAINALTESLMSVKTVYEQEIKTQMLEDFVDTSMAKERRADNFTGKGPNSQANCQMKKRSSASKLSEEEVALLKSNGISVDTAIVSEEIPEHFYFNPEILSNPEIAAIISEKLSEIPELEGKQVIIKQAKRDKVTKEIVSDNSFDEIARLKDRELVKQLLSIVSSLAIKDKLNTQDMDVVMDLVRKSGIKL